MKIVTNRLPIYSIQENGLIAFPGLGEGRLIPAVVLNGSAGHELKEFLIAHVSTIERGDVVTQWASPVSQFFKPKVWFLYVKFLKPRALEFYIEFVLEQHPKLIDAIFQSRGLYVRYGFLGDKISKQTAAGTVLVEVPDLGQDRKWEDTFREILKGRLKKERVPKNLIKSQIENQIRESRELLHFRK